MASRGTQAGGPATQSSLSDGHGKAAPPRPKPDHSAGLLSPKSLLWGPGGSRIRVRQGGKRCQGQPTLLARGWRWGWLARGLGAAQPDSGPAAPH